MKIDPQRRTFDESLMHDLARYIEDHCHENVTLAVLAEQADLSPAHLQRCFKKVMGVSPKEYREACRLGNLKTNLRNNESVSDAIYSAGFGSPSRVYERVDSRLGMTPARYRDGGRGLEISYATDATPLGRMLIGATDRGICCLHFGDSPAALLSGLKAEFPHASIREMDSGGRKQFAKWMEVLSAFMNGLTQRLDLPVDLRGTVFQIEVWRFLQSIPAGSTATYAEVAEAVGRPKGARAVANSCANNHVAVIIPCHRVIRGDGSLSGYRWGVERKRRLLELERRGAGH